MKPLPFLFFFFGAVFSGPTFSAGDLDPSGEESLKVLANRTNFGAKPRPVDIVSPDEDTDIDNGRSEVVNGVVECQYQRQTKVHATDPNLYYYRFYRENGNGGCAWTAWRSKAFAIKPFPKAVKVNGRWYESPNSNRFYEGYGRWRERKSVIHPRNPTLRKVAGRWVKRANPPKGVVKGPNGKWYNGPASRYYWRRGKWVKEARRRHPFDPRLMWRSGRWQRKPESKMPGWKKFSLRNGRWYRAPPGDRPLCFQYWRNGRWVEEPAMAEKGNDPRYRYTKAGKFVRRPRSATLRYTRRIGRWYKSKWSNLYYKNARWVKDSPRWRDPTWRRRGGKWIRVKRRPAWRKFGNTKAGRPSWYRSSSKTQYWWYGKWVRRQLTPLGTKVMMHKVELALLKDSPAPYNLKPDVDRVSNQYFSKFLKWFLRDYLRSTVQDPHLIKAFDTDKVEPGSLPSPRQLKLEPEAPGLARVVHFGDNAMRAAPIDLSHRNPLRDRSIPKRFMRRFLTPEEVHLARLRAKRAQYLRDMRRARILRWHRNEDRTNQGLKRDAKANFRLRL